MFKQVFLDLDGVLVDWDKGVREWFGIEYYPTEWAIDYSKFEMTEEYFWNSLDTNRFWKNLPWTSDGKEILTMVKPFKPCILSHPAAHQGYPGRLEWIKRELPDFYKEDRYLLGKGKYYVSRPGAILIDDSDRNCQLWNEAGGRAILYPRPWNQNRHVPFPAEFLMNMLMDAMEAKI